MILKAQIWLTSFGEMSLRFVAKKKKKQTLKTILEWKCGQGGSQRIIK